MQRHAYHTLQILDHIEQTPLVTNRKVASKLGVSVKLAHALLTQLVQKGMLDIKKYHSRRWDYFLTPHGLAEKARLTYEFMNFTMQFYREARKRSSEALARVRKAGVKKIAFLGVSELAEIAYLGVQEQKLELLDIFDDAHAGRDFLGAKVKALADVSKSSAEKILVTAFDPTLPMGEYFFPQVSQIRKLETVSLIPTRGSFGYSNSAGFGHDKHAERELKMSATDSAEGVELSLFFPCYNDAGTIGSIVALADVTASTLTESYEIIAIDDGSTDRSREILSALEKKYPRLRLIFHDANRGYGGALRSGFSAARGEWVFYTDGDYQYDIGELKVLWGKADASIDVVNGFKVKRHDPLYRVWIGLAYQYAIQVAFCLKIRDVDCDFRLIRRSALGKFTLKENTGCICIELVKKLQETGARFAEVGVKHMFRAYGHSQFFNFRRVGRTLWKLWRLWIKLVIRKDYELLENSRA